ncbi:alpha/beta hydrolase fold protein [Tanacetum coccineum]|uniref:Alpha/beta hydrolase fold protein n=1 Tax=Tanacetum coccineum TaxID=301880 RepID=A0ABQ5AW63_9ASTR
MYHRFFNQTSAMCLLEVFWLYQVAQGISEFKPTPTENRECCKNSYNVPKTLLVKFNTDANDETDLLEENLRPRVEAIDGTLDIVSLSGNHITPCIQVKIEVQKWTC